MDQSIRDATLATSVAAYITPDTPTSPANIPRSATLTPVNARNSRVVRLDRGAQSSRDLLAAHRHDRSHGRRGTGQHTRSRRRPRRLSDGLCSNPHGVYKHGHNEPPEIELEKSMSRD